MSSRDIRITFARFIASSFLIAKRLACVIEQSSRVASKTATNVQKKRSKEKSDAHDLMFDESMKEEYNSKST